MNANDAFNILFKAENFYKTIKRPMEAKNFLVIALVGSFFENFKLTFSLFCMS